MIRLYDGGIYLLNGTEIITDDKELAARTGRPADRARSLVEPMGT